MAGLIATNTISQGDTREIGLEQLSENGAKFFKGNYIDAVAWRGSPGSSSRLAF